jgi:hypothetical protein
MDRRGQDALYEQAITEHGTVIRRLSRGYEADPERRRDLRVICRNWAAAARPFPHSKPPATPLSAAMHRPFGNCSPMTRGWQESVPRASTVPLCCIIRLLLERGAPVDVKDNSYNAIPLDMALWKWHNSPDKERRDRCYEAIALQARVSAILDRDHWNVPQGFGILGKIDSDPAHAG